MYFVSNSHPTFPAHSKAFEFRMLEWQTKNSLLFVKFSEFTCWMAFNMLCADAKHFLTFWLFLCFLRILFWLVLWSAFRLVFWLVFWLTLWAVLFGYLPLVISLLAYSLSTSQAHYSNGPLQMAD